MSPMLDVKFINAVEPLYNESMGTENVSYLLYSLIKMLRPMHVLEVGAGYTSVFLAQALRENYLEVGRLVERKSIEKGDDIVVDKNKEIRTDPGKLTIIDSLQDPNSTAAKVESALVSLDLSEFVTFEKQDIAVPPSSDTEYDFIWYDCGGPNQYIDFFNNYWPRLSKSGCLVFHMAYWPYPVFQRESSDLYVSPFTQEFINKSNMLGEECDFEIVNISEPLKIWQNSITIIKKKDDVLRTKNRMSFVQYLETFGFKVDKTLKPI